MAPMLIRSVAMLPQAHRDRLQLAEMPKWKATPLVVKRALVVEGGWLQTPWVVDSQPIDGVDFVALVGNDRSLAKALGMNMSDRSPLTQCSVFAHMAAIRDKQVDALVFARKLGSDPLGEVDPLGHADTLHVPSRGRALAFACATVPATISIAVWVVSYP